jgi:hypothetical protein
MRRSIHVFIAAIALAAVGCGQDEITLPDQGGAPVGECGAWYPGGGEADAGIEYGAQLGDTLPCFVWTSVRVGPPDPGETDPVAYANAYLSMPEIFLKSQDAAMTPYLEAQFGVSEAKIILFAIGATECSNCPTLMEAVANSEEELFEHGVIPIGALSYISSNQNVTEAWDLITADETLLNDGVDEALYRTNDPEHYLGDRSAFPLFPYIIAVRVSDMAVAVRADGLGYVDDGSFKVDELVAAVEAFTAP